MSESTWRAERFEAERARLRGVAYRMLGSLSEAEDAVQEAWLRFDRAETDTIDNVSAWLTTVVSRLCLDQLRRRRSRREDAADLRAAGEGDADPDAVDPDREAQLADSVGLALLVVLETLSPAERLAFVLHDLFGVPFDEIAPLVDRSPMATRKLASRARNRIKGPPAPSEVDRARQRKVVEAFLAASRQGDFEGLVAVLDPDVHLRVDPQILPIGVSAEARGAHTVAARAKAFSRGATSPVALSLIDGSVGLILAPNGRLQLAQTFTVVDGKITEIELIADPQRLEALQLAVLD